ncbi:MAG: glyoxylate/hydroxypyruvate reductase A [Pseudomonadota bacterium]
MKGTPGLYSRASDVRVIGMRADGNSMGSGSGMRPGLVVHVGASRAGWWRDHMAALLPDHDVHLWDEVPDPATIRYAVVWKHPPGGLRRFANLHAILSIGAGVDHVLVDPDLPAGVPVIRTTGAALTQRMREYVCLHVLRMHRQCPTFQSARAERRWHQPVLPPAPMRGVGIMGLGGLGQACATALAGLGFAVSGWARSRRALPGIAVYAGAEERDAFLAASEILVCLLPLTAQTQGVLNASLFDRLPRGACLINAARGRHLVEEALIPALDAGALSHAVLDVFRTEPLPDAHPFWDDPRIDITCHSASLIDPEAGGRLIADNIRRIAEGAPVPDLVDTARGY